MQPTFSQPQASPIPHDLVGAILRHAAPEVASRSFEIRHHHHFSNDVAVVTVAGERRMMIKRGRHPWSRERFGAARRASRLLREKVGIIAPRIFNLPADLGEAPVEAYWRIELPLFADLWVDLKGDQREAAMRSLGGLVRRAHSASGAINLDLGHGPTAPPSTDVLESDLVDRLLPAVSEVWPDALPLLELLIRTTPAARSIPTEAAALHGDLHLGNVLCRVDGEDAVCVGLIDLEWAHFGPPESDLARLRVMHSGPFGMSVDARALSWVLEGYGKELDQRLLTYYSLYHYLNLGFYSALIGHEAHAEQVAEAAAPTAEELREELEFPDVAGTAITLTASARSRR